MFTDEDIEKANEMLNKAFLKYKETEKLPFKVDGFYYETFNYTGKSRLENFCGAIANLYYELRKDNKTLPIYMQEAYSYGMLFMLPERYETTKRNILRISKPRYDRYFDLFDNEINLVKCKVTLI